MPNPLMVGTPPSPVCAAAATDLESPQGVSTLTPSIPVAAVVSASSSGDGHDCWHHQLQSLPQQLLQPTKSSSPFTNTEPSADQPSTNSTTAPTLICDHSDLNEAKVAGLVMSCNGRRDDNLQHIINPNNATMIQDSIATDTTADSRTSIVETPALPIAITTTLQFISKITQTILRARVLPLTSKATQWPNPFFHVESLLDQTAFWKSGAPMHVDVFLKGSQRILLERWVVSYEWIESGIESISSIPSSNNDLTDLILLAQSLYSYIRFMPLQLTLADWSSPITPDHVRYCISLADGTPLAASQMHSEVQLNPHDSMPAGSSGFDLGAKLKAYRFKPAGTATSGRLHLSVVYDSCLSVFSKTSSFESLTKVTAAEAKPKQEAQSLSNVAHGAVLSTGSLTQGIPMQREGSPLPSPTLQRRAVSISQLKLHHHQSQPSTLNAFSDQTLPHPISNEHTVSSPIPIRGRRAADRMIVDMDDEQQHNQDGEEASDDDTEEIMSTTPTSHEGKVKDADGCSLKSIPSSPMRSYLSPMPAHHQGSSSISPSRSPRFLSTAHSRSPLGLNPPSSPQTKTPRAPPPSPASLQPTPNQLHFNYSPQTTTPTIIEPFGSLVGSYEQSILTGRMSTLPSRPITFVAEIGVIGSGKRIDHTNDSSTGRRGSAADDGKVMRTPAHVNLAFPAYFFELRGEDTPSTPYVGTIDIEGLTGLVMTKEEIEREARKQAKKASRSKEAMEVPTGSGEEEFRKRWVGGYRIPAKGQLQIIIKNPTKTAVKVFLVPYDFREMTPGTKTFLRQKVFVAPKAAVPVEIPPEGLQTHRRRSWNNFNQEGSRERLRDAIHLQFYCTPGGRIYLTKTIRVVFSQRTVESDQTTRVVCEGPDDPTYIPCKHHFMVPPLQHPQYKSTSSNSSKPAHFTPSADGLTANDFVWMAGGGGMLGADACTANNGGTSNTASNTDMPASPTRRRSSFGASLMALAGVSLQDYSVSPVRSPSSFTQMRFSPHHHRATTTTAAEASPMLTGEHSPLAFFSRGCNGQTYQSDGSAGTGSIGLFDTWRTPHASMLPARMSSSLSVALSASSSTEASPREGRSRFTSGEAQELLDSTGPVSGSALHGVSGQEGGCR